MPDGLALAEDRPPPIELLAQMSSLAEVEGPALAPLKLIFLETYFRNYLQAFLGRDAD